MAVTTPRTPISVTKSSRRVRNQMVAIFNLLSFVNRPARRFLALALFFVSWQILCVINFKFLLNFQLLPSPVEVFKATIDFFMSDPGVHIRSSIQRVLFGYAIASVLAMALGVLVGWFEKVEDFLMPPLELLRPIPAVAWIPLAILMFPNAESGMIYITFIGAFFPVLISTIKGVESTLSDTVLIRVGQCLGAKPWHIFKDIVLPGSLPSIASGLTIGMGNAWFCLVTAEILAGRYGVGYITWESYVTSNYPPIVMGMLLIGLMGAFSSWAVSQVTTHFMPWRTIKKQDA
ncbi:MAG: ABC transporter permease [Kamptonema sp. SIO4C4]|nr:ABC transporter permease [Kamptonema sp. SIO4C4]